MITTFPVGSGQPLTLRTRPTRVSVEKGDPGLLPEACFGQPDPVVYLDGARQQLVVTADSEKGIVRRFKLFNGQGISDGDRFEIEELMGRVEIKMV